MTDLERKERRRITCKKYYENNKKEKKIYYKKYYENNKEKINEQERQYRKNNKEKINKTINNRKKTDLLFKLKINIRSLISNSIKRQGYSKNTKTYQILGCTFEEFRQHLERQFTLGMTWHNQGEWHLDHIYPVSLAKDEQELVKLNHYTNFQPLWAADNLLKGNKVIPSTQIKLV